MKRMPIDLRHLAQPPRIVLYRTAKQAAEAGTSHGWLAKDVLYVWFRFSAGWIPGRNEYPGELKMLDRDGKAVIVPWSGTIMHRTNCDTCAECGARVETEHILDDACHKCGAVLSEQEIG